MKRFCASDWPGVLKASRPAWTGATTAGSPGHETTQCLCVQATHWCDKAASCSDSCDAAGLPAAANYCVPDHEPSPAPPPGALCATTSMVGTGTPCNQQTSAQARLCCMRVPARASWARARARACVCERATVKNSKMRGGVAASDGWLARTGVRACVRVCARVWERRGV
jgi:hypothetical protein